MPTFETDGAPWDGGRMSSRLVGLRANNPSPMTYTGTNSWIVADPLAQACAVIDPAPEGEQVERILRDCEAAGMHIAAIVVTHDHPDHTAGVPQLVRATHAPLFAWGSACLERLAAEARRDGEGGPGVEAECHEIAEGPLCLFEGAPAIEVVHLPGHSSDSIGLILSEEKTMLTGDVVFRHGPTVVFHPDGDLGAYFATLDALEALVESGAVERMAPAHGHPINNPLRAIKAAREHRVERLDQVRRALADGVPANAEALFDVVYAGVDPRLKDASLRSIRAQLIYLGVGEQVDAMGQR